MSVLTSDEILESIKRTFSMPSHQQLLSDEEILRFCDEELSSKIYPEIITCRGDYFTTTESVTLASGTSRVRVPYRANARGLRDIILRLPDGSERNLNDITLDQKHKYSSNTTGQPRFFYMKGDYVYLVPTSDSVYYLDLSFDVRPSKLVKVSEAAKITAVNFTTDTVSLETDLSGLAVTDKCDLISAESANIPLGMNYTPTAVGSLSVTFSSDLPSELVAGDYLTFAKESPFVAMPEECLPTLIQAAGNRVMQAIGDFEAMNGGIAKLKDLIAQMKVLLAPRVRGESPIAMNQHFIGNNFLTSRYRRG